MEVVLSFVVGGLYAAGLYMVMRRNIVKLIIGLALLGHAANLLIFTLGGLVRGAPPLVGHGSTVPADVYADPLPQALILTAIVIGFGVQSFAIVLVKNVAGIVGTDDLDRMKNTDT